MSGTLRFESRLIDLAREYFDAGRLSACREVLSRVLSFASLPPDEAAQANYLLAQVHFETSDIENATQSLRESVRANPNNADYRFRLAQALEESEESQEALGHYAAAVRLDPGDGRKVTGYARVLARVKNADQGLRLLGCAYRSHGAEPAVVEEVVEGLLENDRLDDAELVVRQASYRYGQDHGFRRLRDRFRTRSLESRLYRKPINCDGASEILPFRNPSNLSLSKPGGARRPKRDENFVAAPASKESSTHPAARGPIAVDEGMTLPEILRRSGSSCVAGIYDNLGLMGKTDPSQRSRDVVGALSDNDNLASIVRGLPLASRRLLKSVVQLGGYVPAAAVFQTAGPDAPPPDFAQPLLAAGLVYFGRSTKRRANKNPLMLVVPIDLLGRLARVLRVKIGI